MIRRLQLGFATLTIDEATMTGSASFGNTTIPVTAFEYLAQPGLGARSAQKVRFELEQDVPGMRMSPFKAAIEAELISDFVV